MRRWPLTARWPQGTRWPAGDSSGNPVNGPDSLRDNPRRAGWLFVGHVARVVNHTPPLA
jgi:hypothetical protein